MPSIRLAVLFFSLVFQQVFAKDVEPSGSHRRLLTCSNPYGFYLAATLDVQTYYPSYCSASAISEIGSFLFFHFKSYSAYDPTTGAIEVIPATQAPTICTSVRRNLLETSNNNEIESESSSKDIMHRNLGIPGFVFKLPAQCKSCKPDDGDGRRRLANTSPVTFRVKTDSYPGEFSFRIVKVNSFGFPATVEVYRSSGMILPNFQYNQTIYLEPNTRYQVIMKDQYGDGICCRYGAGFFQLVAGPNLNGNTLLYDKGDFTNTRTLNFFTPPTPPVVKSSSSLIDIGQLQIKYSEYLTFYLQQTYHTDVTKCLYGMFPLVAVSLKEVSYIDAMASC